MTPALPPQNPPKNFIAWWDTHPHSSTFTAAEAWLFKRYREQWEEACRDKPRGRGEQWWDR
jgi:hypothetical protein